MIDPRHIDLLKFIATWYGPPCRREAPLPPSHDWLPEPLLEWHRMAARWDAQLTHTTSMIPPERIRVSSDGMAIFMVDATADWRWCFASNDPYTVYDSERYEPWEKNVERLSDLLVHNTVREAIYGTRAKKRAAAVPREALTEILSPMEEVAFGSWKWPAPGYRIFTGKNMLAEIVKAEHDPGWDIEVAAPEFGRLSHLENLIDVHWRT